jgi:transcriptional regulator with XRE-family HTH domain
MNIIEQNFAQTAIACTLIDVQNTAQCLQYAFVMAKPRPKTRNTLAHKLKALMDASEMTQRGLAAASGVSQRQISNIVRGENSPSIEVAEALARPFGLTGWQLISPNIPANYKHARPLNDLITAYTQASEEVRRYIDVIVERERKAGRTPTIPMLEKLPAETEV